MKQEVKEIQFYNDTLLGVRDANGQVWLGVKKTCLDIGLTDVQARSQVEKIKQDYVLKSNCRKFPIVQMEGKREVERTMDCIKEDFVTLWLAKITLTPTMQREVPWVVEKLAKYQLETR